MKRNDKIYRTEISAYRSDGMQVYLPTRAVYFDMFHWLSACCFRTLYPTKNLIFTFTII